MIYPLTKGLIASMCLRYDHSYGIDYSSFPEYYRDDPLLRSIFGETDKLKIANKMLEFYKLFAMGHVPLSSSDEQIYEEITGKGFYHPDRESSYSKLLPKEFELK